MFKFMLALAALALSVTIGMSISPSQPAQAGSANTLPACKYEDGSGSGRVCVWDARHRGNGRGDSFIKVGTKYTVISHRVAHRLTH